MPSYVVMVARFANRVVLLNSPPGTSVLRTGAWCSSATGPASVYGSSHTHATQEEAIEAFAQHLEAREEQAIVELKSVLALGLRRVDRFDDMDCVDAVNAKESSADVDRDLPCSSVDID